MKKYLAVVATAAAALCTLGACQESTEEAPVTTVTVVPPLDDASEAEQFVALLKANGYEFNFKSGSDRILNVEDNRDDRIGKDYFYHDYPSRPRSQVRLVGWSECTFELDSIDAQTFEVDGYSEAAMGYSSLIDWPLPDKRNLTAEQLKEGVKKLPADVQESCKSITPPNYT